MAYITALAFPKPITGLPFPLERVSFAICGAALLSNLFIKSSHGWGIIGVFYVYASLASYLGYSEWKVLWRSDTSDAAQIAMWAWDLGIAVCCFLKTGFTL